MSEAGWAKRGGGTGRNAKRRFGGIGLGQTVDGYHEEVGVGAYRREDEGWVAIGAATGGVGPHICGKERGEPEGVEKVGGEGGWRPRQGEWLNREVQWPMGKAYDKWLQGG